MKRITETGNYFVEKIWRQTQIKIDFSDIIQNQIILSKFFKWFQKPTNWLVLVQSQT